MNRAIRTGAALVLGLGLAQAPVGAASGPRPKLEPCGEFSESARCGRLSVPEDPATAGGRKIDLSIVVLPALERTGAEPVFMLAGGPGQAASALASLGLNTFAEVNKVRDFVLVDHRGAGKSNPINCPSDVESDPSLAFGQLFDPAAVSQCLAAAEKHADVTRYTSRYAAADLEAVRKWLGYDKILLWGASGGTRTGLVYMREFPSHVAAALFDGLAPTHIRAPSGFAPSAQRALGRVFEDCALQPSCAQAFPELERDFERALALFDDGPLEASFEANDEVVQVRMHRTDFAYAVRGILYSKRRIARLPRMIHRAAATGDVGEFASAHWRRMVGVLPSIALGVHFGVYCAEDLPFIEWKKVEHATQESFLGRYLIDQYGNACNAWRSVPEPIEFTEPVRSEVPVLLFSGYYDPTTPDGTAEEVARHLPRSRHIVARNEGHGGQFGCARPLAIEFLLEASLEGLGPACEGVGPIEFEVPEAERAIAP